MMFCLQKSCTTGSGHGPLRQCQSPITPLISRRCAGYVGKKQSQRRAPGPLRRGCTNACNVALVAHGRKEPKLNETKTSLFCYTTFADIRLLWCNTKSSRPFCGGAH